MLLWCLMEDLCRVKEAKNSIEKSKWLSIQTSGRNLRKGKINAQRRWLSRVQEIVWLYWYFSWHSQQANNWTEKIRNQIYSSSLLSRRSTGLPQQRRNCRHYYHWGQWPHGFRGEKNALQIRFSGYDWFWTGFGLVETLKRSAFQFFHSLHVFDDLHFVWMRLFVTD